jgi:hypothetical protein
MFFTENSTAIFAPDGADPGDIQPTFAPPNAAGTSHLFRRPPFPHLFDVEDFLHRYSTGGQEESSSKTANQS